MMETSWEDQERWLWRAERVTGRQYPCHGSDTMDGALTGRTSTDYFHFDCPKCGPDARELDAELLGIRDDQSDSHPNAKTIVIGLKCRTCGLTDLAKIGCLEDPDYQPRREFVEMRRPRLPT